MTEETQAIEEVHKDIKVIKDALLGRLDSMTPGVIETTRINTKRISRMERVILTLLVGGATAGGVAKAMMGG